MKGSLSSLHHLQMLVEQEKTDLARAIHDDLGGHLIATAMDLAVLKRRFVTSDADTLEKIDRAILSLTAAVDMMRRVTEVLHPTLLDNVGLFAALRWQLNQICQRSNIACRDHLPSTEPKLRPATAISLFRVGQEALILAENQADTTAVDLSMDLQDGMLVMTVRSNGSSETPHSGSRGYIALEFLRHRVDAMDGIVALGQPPEGGLILTAKISLDTMSLSETQAVRTLETAFMPYAQSTSNDSDHHEDDRSGSSSAD